MLIFNKLLPVFVLPIGVVCLLIVVAIWTKRRWPAVVALAVLYLGSIPLVAERLVARLEGGSPPVALAAAVPADAIVVLGGILGPATPPGFVPNWSETSERFEAGIALLQADRAGRLVFTGARRYWLTGETSEGEQLRRLALARGVPADRMVVTDWVDNTSTEAAAVAALLPAEGGRRVLLVTSAWHMRRSLWLFRRAGLDAIPFPVDFHADPGRPLAARDFVPNAGAWSATELAIREWYGYAFYRLFR